MQMRNICTSTPREMGPFPLSPAPPASEMVRMVQISWVHQDFRWGKNQGLETIEKLGWAVLCSTFQICRLYTRVHSSQSPPFPWPHIRTPKCCYCCRQVVRCRPQVDHPNGSSRSITLLICTAFKHVAAEGVACRGPKGVWEDTFIHIYGLAGALKHDLVAKQT